VELLAQYRNVERIAASLPNKVSDLEPYNLNSLVAQASGTSPTADPPKDDKKDSSELVTNGNHERSFVIGDVPPISATSRSHLMDLKANSFSIPGSSSGSTLPLYS
jgi:hypothetical protein